MPYFPAELFSIYTSVEFLERGGFARVFKAIRKKDNTQVAVKIPLEMDPDIGKSFLKEILGLPENIAEIEACKMEHGLSRETLARLERFIKTVLGCRGSKDDCRTKFFSMLKTR